MLMIETLYNLINLVFAWFAPVSCFAGSFIVRTRSNGHAGKLLFIPCEYLEDDGLAICSEFFSRILSRHP